MKLTVKADEGFIRLDAGGVTVVWLVATQASYCY